MDLSATSTSKPTIWFHIHIPKTAGSTLRTILSRNFQKSYFTAVSLLEHHKLSIDDTREIVQKHHRWLRCYSDHRLSLDVPFDSDLIEARAIAFVRDPVSQVLSQYNFQRNHHKRRTEVEAMTLNEFVEKKFARPQKNAKRRNSRGLQLQRLIGSEFGKNLGDIKELLDQGKLFLFPLEEFDLACTCMEKMFPESFTSTAYIHANRSKEKADPDPGFEQQLRQYVAPDFDLHNMSQWFLNSLSTAIFENPGHLKASVADLQVRCRTLQSQRAAA